jgi:hypothetical protein
MRFHVTPRLILEAPGVAQRQAVTEFLNGGAWKRGSVFPSSGPNVFIVDVHTMVADLQQDDPILH